MLGYINVDVSKKGIIRKCVSSVQKINADSKLVNVYLNKKFNMSNSNDVKKIVKILKKEKIDTAIFHKDVYKEYNIIEYIFDLCKNVKLEEIHLGIAMDLLSYNKLEFIRQIANKVRGLTILTTATSKFDNLSKEILNEYGLVIKCTDNFKSGLKDCNICVNFDLDNSRVVNCISNKCILINCNKRINKMRKAFKGIVVNDINIDIFDIDIDGIEVDDYRSLAIAQAVDFYNLNRKILFCIGLNGKIDNEEFVKFKIYKGKK